MEAAVVGRRLTVWWPPMADLMEPASSVAQAVFSVALKKLTFLSKRYDGGPPKRRPHRRDGEVEWSLREDRDVVKRFPLISKLPRRTVGRAAKWVWRAFCTGRKKDPR